MSKIIPCPFCRDPDPAIDEIKPKKFALCCNDCGAIGPEDDTPEEAIAKWNARAFIPRGEPTEEVEA